MPFLLLTLMLLTAAAVQPPLAAPPTRFVVAAESRLWIEGTSSLHDWRCDLSAVEGWLEIEPGEESFGTVLGGRFTAPADGLSCKNGTMDKKARVALDAEAHPRIRYVIGTVEALRSTAAAQRLAATGRLTVAGAEETVAHIVSATRLAEGRYRFTSTLTLKMSDFGIEPPTALLGTLKTGDAVVVHLDLIVAPAPVSESR